MQSNLQVDLYGTVECYLDIYFEWHRDGDDISVHMSQEAYATKLITEHHMSNTNPAPTPHRSGMPVDDIPKSHLTPLDIITTKYQ
jgi:hypothetical protein